MAAASAGSTQSGPTASVVPVSSGGITVAVSGGTAIGNTIVDAQMPTIISAPLHETQSQTLIIQQQQPQNQQNNSNNSNSNNNNNISSSGNNLIFQRQQPYYQQSNISNLQNHHVLSQRQTFLPRVGSLSQMNNLNSNGNNNNNNNSSNVTSRIITAGIVAQQQLQQQSQHQQQQLQIINATIATSSQPTITVQQQHRQQSSSMPNQAMNASANLAPGWRRLIANNEVIYVSPSGSTLRTHGQIKDYLLSQGTCKCGLPCPFRPEYFFNFNSQVPSVLLQIPQENLLSSRSSSLCTHQRRYFENQQNVSQKDFKRRKFVDSSGKIITSPAPQCNSVAVYSGNVMQTSQVLTGNNGRLTHVTNAGNNQIQQQQAIGSGAAANIVSVVSLPNQKQQLQLQSDASNNGIIVQLKSDGEKQIGSVTLSKTPPWRKNSLLQQGVQQQQPQQKTIAGQQHNYDRVPPLPVSHVTTIQGETPPWQHQQQPQQHSQDSTSNTSQIRFIKTARSPLITTKKKPNFKDDPTGYMDHQTAILHNSILNVVQAGDDLSNSNEEREVSETSLRIATNAQKQELLETIGSSSTVQGGEHTIKIDPNTSFISQHQGAFNTATGATIEVSQASGVTRIFPAFGNFGQNEHQEQQSMILNSNISFHQNNTKLMNSGQIINSGSSSNVGESILKGNQAQLAQQIITNAPSSQQIIGSGKGSLVTVQTQYNRDLNDRAGHQVQITQQRPQLAINQQQQQQSATTTIIGGQTITQLPNGLVQVENNCDNNNIVTLKPQQHIQLQQQIHQHNILYKQNQHMQKALGKSSHELICNSGGTLVSSNDTQIKQSVTIRAVVSQESPVSSSTTTIHRSVLAEKGGSISDGSNNKGPAQVGAISTSDQSMYSSSSQSESSDSLSCSPVIGMKVGSLQTSISNPTNKQGIFATSQTTGRNTITSVTAGRAITATTSVSDKNTIAVSNASSFSSASSTQSHKIGQQHQQNNVISLSSLQLQPTATVLRESSNQLIMTSTGQILVVPTQSTNKSPNQVIINSPTGNNLVVNNPQTNVLINQPNTSATVVNNSPQLIGGNTVDATSAGIQIHSPNGGSLVIQNSGILQQGQNILQSPNNLLTTNSGSNFIVNSSNNMQPMILNNSTNIIQQATNGQNLLSAAATNIIQNSGNSANLVSTANGTKVISNNGTILNNHQSIITNQANVINGGANGNLLGQQTVVLNTLPNGYVIQPNFTTVDGQVVSQIVSPQDNGNISIIQQQSPQQRQVIITSPDTKKKTKKRKSSTSSSPSTPSSLSPQQSPTIQNQISITSGQMQSPSPNNSVVTAGGAHIGNNTNNSNTSGTVVQIATPQYQTTQGFQISPGIQGIVVNKNTTQTGNQNTTGTATGAHQQQILFQNGQIIQPVNLIGQQLLVPAGLVMAPTETTTLVQIQNVGSCGSILTTPQGMVLRAPSPQNKNFISTNSSGQQFIVSGNSQMSPLGQIYSTPVGLMVSQSNSGTATFVQQNSGPGSQVAAALMHQQQAGILNNTNITNSNNIHNRNNNSNGSIGCVTETTSEHSLHSHASPPDTTTHSPRSPERPPSERSGESDMVQCVSSSEPDSVISPPLVDSAQSPSTTDTDRHSGGILYHTENIYKPSDAKIRKLNSSSIFGGHTQDIITQMKPDSHESPTTSSPPIVSATSTTQTTLGNSNISSSGNCGNQLPSFSIGELVWGPAHGHPAWPGKVINPPDGICTPSDSTWVQWFGGRPNIELVAINSLKSLSEGLEAHHKAQKDTRKSRKLNSQLEKAIQEAMAELDRMSTSSSSVHHSTGSGGGLLSQNSTNNVTTGNVNFNPSLVAIKNNSRSRGRQLSASVATNFSHPRTKPIRIAPAPPNNTIINTTMGLRNNLQQRQAQKEIVTSGGMSQQQAINKNSNLSPENK